MAGLLRKTLFNFAAGASNNGQFGSAQLGTKILSNDPLVIQGTTGSGSTLAPSTAWEDGWLDAVIGGNNLPPLEEMQGVQYVHSYEISYILERGIPEYDGGTTYNTGDITRPAGSSQLYQSLINANVANSLPNAVTNANWKYLGDLANISTPPSSLRGGHKNLIGQWSSNTTTTYTADQVILTNSSNSPFLVNGLSISLNTATSAAGGLDTGSTAANTWYYVFTIYNGTTVNSLMSLSATSPTLPSGYTYFARISSLRLDGSKNIVGFFQRGSEFQYLVGDNLAGLPELISGVSGDVAIPTWTLVTLANTNPPTASKIILSLSGESSVSAAATMAAPNSSYGAYNSTSNPPPMMITGGPAPGAYLTMMGNFVPEGSGFYYASANSVAGLYAVGYQDNL